MIKTLLGVLLLLALSPVEGLPAAAADETYSISGTVTFNGPAPAPKPVKEVKDDQNCNKLHENAPLRDNLVVNPAGGVKWAFVYVKKGLEGKEFAAPEKPVLLDQVGCMYSPHVFGIMVGQPLEVRNSDPLLHNIHALPMGGNAEFNRGQPAQGQVDRFKFKTPEIGLNIKCDIHPWMRKFACVVENPFYAGTDADGKFGIKNLPPGNYTLGIWHEGLKTPYENDEKPIVVKASQTLNVEMKKK